MKSISACVFFATVLVIGGAVKAPKRKPNPTPVTDEVLQRRIGSLEASQETVQRKVTQMKIAGSNIEQRLTALEEGIGTQEELTTVKELLQQSETKNQELMKMLSNYERFFGALYAETPEAFDPTEAVDVRMTKLNSYLGNREAELLSLRPAPPTIVSNATVNEDLLGTALYELEEQKSQLDRKVRNLEDRIDRITGQIPDHANARINRVETELALQNEEEGTVRVNCQQSNSGSAGPPGQLKNKTKGNAREDCRTKRSIDDSTNQLSDDEVQDRLERLENLVLLLLQLPTINQTLGQSIDRSLSSSQLEELTDEIIALRGSKPDSKKIAFSVARTTPLLGESYEQILEFDYVFVNRGGHFKEENSTFICEVTGYYFVSFTIRSFDGHVLGINLMKNDDHVTSVFTDAHHRNVMESQSVIVHLKKGDHLWLRHPPSERFGIHSDRYRYTTFSAFMIYKGN